MQRSVIPQLGQPLHPSVKHFQISGSGPCFGARFIGHTYPDPSDAQRPLPSDSTTPHPAHKQGLSLIQVDAHNPADIAWVKRMAQLTARQSETGHLSSAKACCHPGVGWPHIRASWQTAYQSLTQWSLEPPVVLLAVNTKKQILGLCVGHVERLHPGLTRQYTNFKVNPLQLAQKTPHTQIEKLYSNAITSGVGKALITAFSQCLPPHIKQVNLCGMHPDLSAKAQKLYLAMGFQPQPQQLDDHRVDVNQPRQRWLTFRQLLTTPMTAPSKSLQHHAADFARQYRYKATDEPVDMAAFTLFVPPEKSLTG
jgi:hypothetical protein